MVERPACDIARGRCENKLEGYDWLLLSLCFPRLFCRSWRFGSSTRTSGGAGRGGLVIVYCTVPYSTTPHHRFDLSPKGSHRGTPVSVLSHRYYCNSSIQGPAFSLLLFHNNIDASFQEQSGKVCQALPQNLPTTHDGCRRRRRRTNNTS